MAVDAVNGKIKLPFTVAFFFIHGICSRYNEIGYKDLFLRYDMVE